MLLYQIKSQPATLLFQQNQSSDDGALNNMLDEFFCTTYSAAVYLIKTDYYLYDTAKKYNIFHLY